ncbi:hypothetical protein CC2G_004739 [Coprinopsis cinerea AmutBmut pab1-1]|nr:hypothetical protein CC2G_004739 [Coprinopsis cinerea AmutBmut pab1-1]
MSPSTSVPLKRPHYDPLISLRIFHRRSVSDGILRRFRELLQVHQNTISGQDNPGPGPPSQTRKFWKFMRSEMKQNDALGSSTGVKSGEWYREIDGLRSGVGVPKSHKARDLPPSAVGIHPKPDLHPPHWRNVGGFG